MVFPFIGKEAALYRATRGGLEIDIWESSADSLILRELKHLEKT